MICVYVGGNPWDPVFRFLGIHPAFDAFLDVERRNLKREITFDRANFTTCA